METNRPVVVKHMPERLNSKHARTFFREVYPLLASDRPQIVFDFSTVKQIDSAGVEMLLQCLAETMKRDGDLKLAAVSQQAAVILELTRTDRLFEIYETPADAVLSFSRFDPKAMRHQPYAAPDSSAGVATERRVPSSRSDLTAQSKGRDLAA